MPAHKWGDKRVEKAIKSEGVRQLLRIAFLNGTGLVSKGAPYANEGTSSRGCCQWVSQGSSSPSSSSSSQWLSVQIGTIVSAPEPQLVDTPHLTQK